MNFERFKSRVAAATEAAKQFKGFDEMAQQDEYIHSPDLNVRQSRGRKRESDARVQPPTVEHAPENDNAAMHTALNSQDVSGHSDDVVRSTSLSPKDEEEDKPLLSSQQRTKMPLLSVVSDIVSEKSLDTRTDPGSGVASRASLTPSSNFLDSSSDDDSLHDARSDDFILNVIRKGDENFDVPNGDARDYRISKSNVEEATKRNNPNRFMEDLDRRLSMPPDLEKGSTTNTVEHTKNTDDEIPLATSFAESENKWNWMRNMASSRVNKMLSLSSSQNDTNKQQEQTPLVSTRRQKPKDPHEEYSVTASSSVLGAEEQAELERMRLATTARAHPLTLLLDLAKQNPQFAFIAFTVVLGSAVYFYARRRGSEDGVS